MPTGISNPPLRFRARSRLGKYRIEQVYLGRMAPPDSGELVAEMRHTLEPAEGNPICVRLLDIGADKRLPFMEFLAESNSSLVDAGASGCCWNSLNSWIRNCSPCSCWPKSSTFPCWFLACSIRMLSVAPPLVPVTKEAARACSVGESRGQRSISR